VENTPPLLPHPLEVLVAGLLFLLFRSSGSLSRDWGLRGDCMNTTALDELIAQVRGTVTALAEVEEKVATVRTELSDQNYKARLEASSGLLKAVAPIPKAATSGWVPAD
jgi:hypothetical protein